MNNYMTVAIFSAIIVLCFEVGRRESKMLARINTLEAEIAQQENIIHGQAECQLTTTKAIVNIIDIVKDQTESLKGIEKMLEIQVMSNGAVEILLPLPDMKETEPSNNGIDLTSVNFGPTLKSLFGTEAKPSNNGVDISGVDLLDLPEAYKRAWREYPFRMLMLHCL